MPSGAKKRKAAKKKKQNQSNNSSHLNGDEDRESDVSENRSPKSQDHEGDEEEIVEGLKVKSDEKQVEVGESVKIQDDESDKKDDEGSSDSSSNTDDENQGGVKNEPSIDSTKVGDSVSVTRNPPIDESATGEKMTLLIEQVEMHNEQSPSAIKQNGEKTSLPLERAIDQSDAKHVNTKSDPRDCAKREFDDTTPPQYNAPPPNNGAHVKDNLVIQPVQTGPTPLFPGQKASWMSCCGLFEVFTQSGA